MLFRNQQIKHQRRQTHGVQTQNCITDQWIYRVILNLIKLSSRWLNEGATHVSGEIDQHCSDNYFTVTVTVTSCVTQNDMCIRSVSTTARLLRAARSHRRRLRLFQRIQHAIDGDQQAERDCVDTRRRRLHLPVFSTCTIHKLRLSLSLCAHARSVKSSRQ